MQLLPSHGASPHTTSRRCNVSNYLGRDRQDINIRVYSYAVTPELMTGPINTVITDENNMMVTCIFSGIPPPLVVWKKDEEVGIICLAFV